MHVHDHPLDWLAEHAERRRAAGLRRVLRHRGCDETALDLAGNDYLGLARDWRVIEAGVAALRAWGAGSTGSRLVTGSTALHAELEGELAGFCGYRSGLVFSSGFLANLGVVTALSGPGALVVSDAANHASLIDACRLSRARVVPVPHNDVAEVASVLARRSEPRALVLTDSVCSVDGDHAPLAALHRVAREHGALLVVDEAHGLGVCGPGGRGRLAEVGLAGESDVVATVTLSKALGSQGGAVLGPTEVIEHLVDTARSFIFDTGLAPASAAAALAALKILRGEPDRSAKVLANAVELAERLTAAGLRASTPAAAVISVRAPSADDALAWSTRCREAGVVVGCFRPPSVPDSVSRLRLTVRADLTEADLDRAVTVITQNAPGR
jgi:8-amino-7-oxononanoate synthase